MMVKSEVQKTALDVSVIITCYNDSSSFYRCIDSVAKQTVNVKEVIIVDDCSIDSDLLIDIIKLFKNINIHYVRNDTNMNGAFSRNRGMSLAHGTFIALLDGDDFWSPEHIEKSFHLINDTNSDFIYANVIELDCFDNRKVRVVTNHISLKNKYDILFFSPPQTNSFFFKKTILEKIRFNETLRRHQDYQFLISALQCNDISVSYVDISTSYYCESHRSSISRVNFDSVFYFWDSNYKLFSKKLLFEFILLQLHTCIKITGGGDINKYFEEYSVLKSDDFNKILYVKLIKALGCDNFCKRVMLNIFFQLRYNNKKIISKIIKLIKNRFLKR